MKILKSRRKLLFHPDNMHHQKSKPRVKCKSLKIRMPSGKEAQIRASSEQIWKPNQCNMTRKKQTKNPLEIEY